MSYPDSPSCLGGRNVVRMVPKRANFCTPEIQAALCAFGNLTKAWCVRFAVYKDIPIDVSESLFNIIWVMVSHILDSRDNEYLLDYVPADAGDARQRAEGLSRD